MQTHEDVKKFLGEDVKANEDITYLREIYNTHMLNINLEKCKLADASNIFEISEISNKVKRLEKEMFKTMNSYEIKCLTSLESGYVRANYTRSKQQTNGSSTTYCLKLFNKFTNEICNQIEFGSADIAKLFNKSETDFDNGLDADVILQTENIFLLKCRTSCYYGNWARSSDYIFYVAINKSFKKILSKEMSISDINIKQGKFFCFESLVGCNIYNEDFVKLSEKSFDTIKPSSNKYHIISRNGLYGYIELSKGQCVEIIEPIFKTASQFTSGRANVTVPYNDSVYTIDIKGNILT